jgi:GT2 family glycosyltransferase
MLRYARDSLRDDAVDAAVRHIDHAWRSHPDSSGALAPIYARFLALDGHDLNATLGLLQRARESSPDPEIEALVASTLLRLGRFEDARKHLATALTEYCVEPGGLLFQVACELAAHPDIDASGWIGRGPKLEFLGGLARERGSRVLDIRIGGREAFKQLVRLGRDPILNTFNLPPPPCGSGEALEVASRGKALLGSGGRSIPADFGFDGRSSAQSTRVTGWTRIGWLPTHPLRVRIEDDKGRNTMTRVGGVSLPVWRWPFWIDVRHVALRGERLRLSAQLPDGRWHPLPDSPLILERALHQGRGKSRRLGAWRAGKSPSKAVSVTRAEATDIVIPVYGGRKETLACIESARSSLDQASRIVVVDDASEDATLVAALDTLAAEGSITLLRNDQNLGFVATVNRGLALHPTHDVVILNSDTLVFGDWIARLRAAAYSGPKVATVTPLSNNGSIASYPYVAGAAVAPAYAAALHALATATHAGVSVEIPVGVGFCLYLRRDCLRDIGFLNAQLFAKGYGEETDYSMRAANRGWSHQLAADVYVYHAGGVSFGRRRLALIERGNRLMRLRYPGYDEYIASFAAQDPLGTVRRRLDEHRLSAFQGRFVLVVTLAMTGGVERFVAERCTTIRGQGLYPLVLKPRASGDRHGCELWTDALDLPNLRYRIPADLDALTTLLKALRLDAVEIQHFLHLDARVIEAVRALPVPYDVFVHDYSWICPRITLIDGSGRYCGEPAVSVCQKCVRRNGSQLGETISVVALRERSTSWLRGARCVTAPSNDAARRLEQHIRGLRVKVKPHADSIVISALPDRAGPRIVTRVALIGAIGDHKGYQVLLACALNARARHLPLEFVVIGYTANDGPLLATGKVFITGRYADGEAPHLLQREHPDVAWLPSVWPETWCYALDYALAAKLPVLAFDLGAIAERVRLSGAGALVPLGLEPAEINDRLLQLAGIMLSAPRTGGRSVQSSLSREGIDANMRLTLAEKNITMNKPPAEKTSQDAHEEALSASVKVLPLPAGVYLFSVKTAGKAPPKLNGQLSLPAVHVGLGPGVRADDVEFVAGPNTHGAWLFAQGDLLVTKTNGQGATLIMTSLRAPGGDVLSIKVEKLDNRAESSAGIDVAAAGKHHDGAPSQAMQEDQIVPLQVAAHVRARGDMTFTDVPWAGRISPGLWIESYSVKPLHRLKPSDIEYKGLTGSGFETPWLTDEKMCGTKGMAVPLVGFAVRLKPSPATAEYECEYSGYFQSGVTIGPLRNGAPCRSTVANDPLEGIQVRLLKRTFAAASLENKPAATAEAAESDSDASNRARRQPVRQPPGSARRPVRRP